MPSFKKEIISLIELGKNNKDVEYSANSMYIHLKHLLEIKHNTSIAYPVPIDKHGQIKLITCSERQEYKEYIHDIISETEITLIPLIIVLDNVNHTICLVYRRRKQIVEYYDPIGKTIANINSFLDFLELNPKKILSPENIHLKTYELISSISNKGTCTLCCLLVMDFILSHQQMSLKEILNLINMHIGDGSNNLSKGYLVYLRNQLSSPIVTILKLSNHTDSDYSNLILQLVKLKINCP